MFEVPQEGWTAPPLPRGPARPMPAPHLASGAVRPIEARVKPGWADLYPNVDPQVWYRVVLTGEFRDDLEGFWIQVSDWVTYVLSAHFDVQEQPDLN